METIQTTPVIYIIDDDDSVRKAMKRLIESTGRPAKIFDSIKTFLNSDYQVDAGCLVLDVHMIGGTGFDLKVILDSSRIRLPVIFVTAHDSLKTREQAKKLGASSYIQKPFDGQVLLDAISDALKGRECTR